MIDSVSDAGGKPPDLKQARRRKPSAPSAAPRIDRLPPHSTEAEQGVLGCILLSPNDCMGECITSLKSAADSFYDLRHQTIYGTLQEMYDAREGIDLVTLQQRLRDRKQLDTVGGLVYLSSLADAVPSAANLQYYLEIVREKHLLRRLIATCTDMVGRVYEHEGEVDTLLDEAERDILQVVESGVDASQADVKELVHKAINTIEEYHTRQGMLTGIGTGFIDFDKMTTGLHEGEMVVIAARPSMGKTSLAMNIVEHVTLELGLPVGVFSLEMTAESLVLRMLCCKARVNLRDAREGFFSERDFPRLTQVAGKLSKAPLHIDDTSGLSILQLRAKARRMHAQHGIKLLVIDYLQLLNSTSRRAQDNRQQEIAEISSGIKALAKELRVPIIVLAQLNRDVEKRPKATPMLSDLRESGAIEQDADLVGLLYKPKPKSDDEDEGMEQSEAEPVNLLIAKQRNGPTGDVNLTFLKSFTRFESAAKVSDDMVPE